MDIASITSQATTVSSQNEVTGSSNLGQDQFLQLLVAQMQNQDPINPMDGKEFAAQLAQFNSVEQLIGVNDSLKSLQESQNMMRMSMANSMAASLTGKEVKALTDQIHLEPEGDATINYELENSAEQVEIIVKSAGGSEVRRETLEGVGSGENSWVWDGKNNDGARMGEGEYTIEVKASNGDDSVKAHTFTKGIADQVRYTANGVLLSVNSVEVPIGDIEAVGTNIL